MTLKYHIITWSRIYLGIAKAMFALYHVDNLLWYSRMLASVLGS